MLTKWRTRFKTPISFSLLPIHTQTHIYTYIIVVSSSSPSPTHTNISRALENKVNGIDSFENGAHKSTIL